MRKVLLVCAMAVFGIAQSSAQLTTEDYGIFNRVGVGLGVGMNGISIDAATFVTPYIGIRAGVDIMPKIKVNTELDLGVEEINKSIAQYNQDIQDFNTQLEQLKQLDPTLSSLEGFDIGTGLPNEINVEGKFSNTTWHVLFDIYPFAKSSSFRITTGLYFGPDKVVSVYNEDQGALRVVTDYNETYDKLRQSNNADVQSLIAEKGLKRVGVELGDYFITPNPAERGDVEAKIKVSSVRPYIGIGFGRGVPKKRVGCQFDLGVQFWSTPKVYAPTYNKNTETYINEQLEDTKAGGDGGDVLKTISKISVYPSMTLRIVGRIL